MEASEKLAEAKYFLTKMNENINDLATFKFNLSAFLSASQSVTEFLKYESAHNPKLNEWYKKKQNEIKDDPILKYFNKKRNTVVHIKTIDLRGHHAVTLIEMKRGISYSVTFELRDADSNIKQTGSFIPESKPISQKVPDKIIITRKWFFTDFKKKDAEVIPLCLKYIKALESMIDEASKNI